MFHVSKTKYSLPSFELHLFTPEIQAQLDVGHPKFTKFVLAAKDGDSEL